MFRSIAVALLLAVPASAEIDVSLGSVRTEDGSTAIGLIANYGKDLDEIFVSSVGNESGWLVEISPEFSLESSEGGEPFSSFIFKAVGNFAFFSLAKIHEDGPLVPTFEKTVHIIPLSLGVETDRTFSDVVFLGEIGYMPFLAKSGVGTKYRVGVFLQTGYKFAVDPETREILPSEDPDSGVSRVKFMAGGYVPLLSDPIKLGLDIDGIAWYDIVNDEVYTTLDATLRISLSSSGSLDFRYDLGAGAPTFEDGSQLGTYVRFTF